ncbi:hypothetical protein C8024_19575 [Sphingopyxis sp. BSNA05]|uniref:hypothetical protein n=1 Tax=Sphingomonadales TaxID=204457 RepID=UPI000C1DF8D8|nr:MULTISPECIES: hypothetical protein [Sphingomonadaceae]ATW04077.1 hypothetical protein CHN51_11460 [Sphingorhabdus sp. YGSMI21]NRD91170.1 hypothetical protein [Sphingopyxis sp. BSNA05]
MNKSVVLTILMLGTAGSVATSAIARDPIAAMMAGESMVSGKKLEQAIERASEHPFGSAENPVRAAMPQGQRAYLNRLQCSDGSAPAYARGGSVGASPYGNMMDVYNVDCGEAAPGKVNVYMDMYHKGHVETEAVPGFTITAP